MALMKVASFSAIADLASGLLANSSNASGSRWRACGGVWREISLDEDHVHTAEVAILVA